MNKNSKAVYVLAAVLLLGGLGWLVFSGLSQDSVYFLNVSEALAAGPDKLASARLFGAVEGDSIRRNPGALGVSFLLTDKDDPSRGIRVDYSGAVPDTFKPGVEVIVEGGLESDGRTFKASTLMTKCPSKYEKIREDEKAAARQG
jgi:cytochrome c-type biogenesis protein CcmE